MKKYSKILVAILLLTLLATTLIACINPDNDKEGAMTLVLINGDTTQEYIVDLAKLPSGSNKSTGLMAVLDYLQDEGKLTYSESGGFLNQVGFLQGNYDDRTYIAIYTSVEKNISVDAYATTLTYKGVKCTTSDKGAKEMSILADCVIILNLQTW